LGSHRRLSPGRLDRTAAIEDEIGGLADLVKAGYIRAIGSSEVRRTRKPQ
jgi:aryl-alcohol dehydrogenase-like predicted oxidoreductase